MSTLELRLPRCLRGGDERRGVLEPIVVGKVLYYDQVQLLLPALLNNTVLETLRRTCGSVDQLGPSCTDQHGHEHSVYWIKSHGRWFPYGAVLQLRQPSQEALNVLIAQFPGLHEPRINGVEFALDLLTNADDAMLEQVSLLLHDHWYRPWHGKKDGLVEYAGTIYIGPRKGANQYAAYKALPSKVTGTSCYHLELRVQGINVTKRWGISTVAGLLSFDARNIWRNRLYLAEVDECALGKHLRGRHGNARPYIKSVWGIDRNMEVWEGHRLLRILDAVPGWEDYNVSKALAKLRGYGISKPSNFLRKRPFLDVHSLPPVMWVGARGHPEPITMYEKARIIV